MFLSDLVMFIKVVSDMLAVRHSHLVKSENLAFAPCGPGAIPLSLHFLTSSPFTLFLIFFIFFFPFLTRFVYFLVFQSLPIPPEYSSSLFPGQLSWEATKPGFSFCMC